jgi:hypothetical protein
MCWLMPHETTVSIENCNSLFLKYTHTCAGLQNAMSTIPLMSTMCTLHMQARTYL